MIPKTIVHLISGGLDSTVLLYDLVDQGHLVHAVAIDYGQTHKQELTFCAEHCDRLGIKMTTLQIPRLLGSRLTDGKGSYVVPNRNASLLCISCNLASVAEAESVTFGSNLDDAAGFPDCRPEFVEAFNLMLRVGGIGVEVCAPYIDKTKREIVQIGRKLAVPMHRTWSCYIGGQEPCQTCPACIKRTAAFQ